jgi:type III pantothenate kinase
MTPSIVIDIGNTRIKWGRCADNRVIATASLPADDGSAWDKQAAAWNLSTPSAWAIAAVHPERLSHVEAWLAQRGDTVRVLRNWLDLRLRVLLDNPERVGMDRLLNTVAANTRGPGSAIIIDAGTAITVDYVDESGCFCGGAILPGLRLMASALHQHTAQLPSIAPPSSTVPLPGRSTVAAIEAGIYWSAVGGVCAVVSQLKRAAKTEPRVFATGGDASSLLSALDVPVVHWPEMTLQGICAAAES